MTVIHDNAGNPISTDNPLPINVNQSDVIQPIDVQSHLQTTIQTHNAVVVPATNGISLSSWIDTDGFTDIAVTMANDAGTNSFAYINYSHDGVSIHGQDVSNVIPVATQQKKVGITQTKTRYIQLGLGNTDASAHTMSAWVYLKA